MMNNETTVSLWVLSGVLAVDRSLLLYLQGKVIENISTKMINSKVKILETSLANSLRLKNTNDIMQKKVY